MKSRSTTPLPPRRRRARAPELAPLAKACALQVWSEETLLQLPWAALEPGKPGRLSYRGRLPDGTRLNCEIVASDGLPGAFDREVFRACEWIAIEEAVRSGGHLPDPFVFTGRSLCERLCLRETLETADCLKAAFRRLAGVRFRGAPSSGLLECVDGFDEYWSGARGLEASRAVHFDAAYRASVKAGRIVTLCWDAWVAAGSAARRLLEILAPAVAGRSGEDEFSVNEADLIRLMPLQGGSSAQVLATAHDELLAVGILRDLRKAGTGSFARFIYAPGKTTEALRERAGTRRPSAVGVLTREVAREIGAEEQDLDALQRLVGRHTPEAVEAATRQVRLCRRWGRLKESPLACFERTLAQGTAAQGVGA